MLLVSNESGKMAHWLDAHPTLDQRIRRLYGRAMAPLSLERQSAATPVAEATVGPGADDAPKWTLS